MRRGVTAEFDAGQGSVGQRQDLEAEQQPFGRLVAVHIAPAEKRIQEVMDGTLVHVQRVTEIG